MANIALLSCSVVGYSVENSDVGKFSAVSVSGQGFKPKIGDSFAWDSGLFVDDTSSEVKVSEQERNIISKHISGSILEHKFQFLADKKHADYLVSAMVLLGDQDIQKVAPFFNAYPHISESINHYEKGSLLVAISRHRGETAQLMWQGAIQLYVVGEDLTEEKRAQRLKIMVRRLMSGLPEAP